MQAAESSVNRSDLLFEQLLEQVRIEIDSSLDSIAADSDEARRICTRDLRFEPDDAALASITEIAGDPTLTGPRREIPRRLLALRVLAERELAGLFAGSGLETQRLRRGVVVVSAVLSALEPLQRELQDALNSSDQEDREYLTSCESALRVSREDLCAALLLVPRIEAFSVADDEPGVREIAPTLSEGEARRVVAFVDGRDGARGEAHRACFDALVLRSLMDEHLGELEDLIERVLPAGDGAEAPNESVGAEAATPAEADSGSSEAQSATTGKATGRSPLDPFVVAQIDTMLGRIDADRVGYQFVSRRLQKQKDMALVAGLKGLIEELGHVGKGLFSSYPPTRRALPRRAGHDRSGSRGRGRTRRRAVPPISRRGDRSGTAQGAVQRRSVPTGAQAGA